jgi:hypothetical protein
MGDSAGRHFYKAKGKETAFFVRISSFAAQIRYCQDFQVGGRVPGEKSGSS